MKSMHWTVFQGEWIFVVVYRQNHGPVLEEKDRQVVVSNFILDRFLLVFDLSFWRNISRTIVEADSYIYSFHSSRMWLSVVYVCFDGTLCVGPYGVTLD